MVIRLAARGSHQLSRVLRSPHWITTPGSSKPVQASLERTWSYSTETSNGSGSKEADATPRKNHWTDGKVREVLEAQNQKLWIQGVKDRLKTHHLPEETKTKVVELLQLRVSELIEKHNGRVSDERSSTHLQTAALVLATHKVLLPFLRNEEEVLTIIKGQMGAATSPMLRYMLKGTLYLSSDPFKSMARRLHSLKSDLGAAVTADITESEQSAMMEVSSCLYNDMFEAEELPQLTSCCCCSVDRMWFEGLERFGVGFSFPKRLSEGDGKCCFKLNRIPKA
mmetsp:Transcript_25805/g.72255  ORF Transcript_25805/g.72255 Transcript_25805/m.72255 type:complete len:281 (+) Transcript_25805:206-1048(+)